MRWLQRKGRSGRSPANWGQRLFLLLWWAHPPAGANDMSQRAAVWGLGRSFVPEKLLAWSCLVLFPQFLTQDGAVLGASSGLRMEYLVDRARFVPHPRWAHLHLLRDPPPPPTLCPPRGATDPWRHPGESSGVLERGPLGTRWNLGDSDLKVARRLRARYHNK